MNGPAICRGCGIQVVWGTNDKTGKAAPIDAAATDDGNVVWLRDGTHYHVLTKDEKAAPATTPRFRNHFSTCPAAREFKKPSAQAAREAFERGRAEG